MMRNKMVCLGLTLALTGLASDPQGEWSLGWGGQPAYAQEAVRNELGKPLQATQELIKARKYKEALAKLHEVDAIGGKTAHENYVIESMRGTAAAGLGDNITAAHAYEAVVSSGRVSGAEQLKIIEAIVGAYYRAKDYGKTATWAQRYVREGGANPQVRTLLAQSQYLAGDCSGVIKELKAEVAAAESGGRTPSEDQLQLLGNCYLKVKDYNGYSDALNRLIAYYPKKEHWANAIGRISRRPGFAGQLLLDVYRLKRATDNVQSTADYMEMTQLALQAGLPAEAKKIVDEGFARKALGTGEEAARHKRLLDLATKQAQEEQKTLAQNEAQAADGTALINVGYAYVTNGKYDKGIALIEKGIAKDGLRRPEDAKLHLGLAYLQAGNKAKAHAVLKTVAGTDGAADLARLWMLQAR